MKLTQLDSWDPGANPFQENRYLMGMKFGKGWVIMHEHHPSEDFEYAILVHTPSGQRWRLDTNIEEAAG